MKVYSSYLCESNQSRANPLLKVTGASNNVCVDYIVLPSDLKKKISHWIIQEIRLKTRLHPVMKHVKYLLIIVSFIQNTFS